MADVKFARDSDGRHCEMFLHFHFWDKCVGRWQWKNTWFASRGAVSQRCLRPTVSTRHMLRSCRTRIVVNMVYHSNSKSVFCQPWRYNHTISVKLGTNTVCRTCGNRHHSVIGNAESKTVETIHRMLLSCFCMKCHAKVDWNGCLFGFRMVTGLCLGVSFLV